MGLPRPYTISIVQIYLLATPIFILLDLLLGVNLRVAFLQDHDIKVTYYGGALFAAVFAVLLPGYALLIGAIEGFINMASFAAVSWWHLIMEAGGSGQSAPPALLTDVASQINFLLTGTMLIVCYVGLRRLPRPWLECDRSAERD